MLQSLVELKYEVDMLKNINSMLNSVYHNALEEASDFSWDAVPEFDKEHYKRLSHMVYDGACPVESVPITDYTVKRDLWDFARCYTISDVNNRLQYTYLVGKARSKDLPISDRTKSSLGVHVGDLAGVKLQENFLSKNLGCLLYDIVFPDSSINFGHIPQVVRMRLFNNSENVVSRNGEKYELYDKEGSLILSAKPGKTLFTRRNTARITYPRNGIKIFDKPSIEECKLILARLAEQYNAKVK